MATEATQPRTRLPRQLPAPLAWLRDNLFNTWYNALISLVLLYVLVQGTISFATWAINAPGWVAVLQNVRLLAVGIYPAELIWRVELVVWLTALLLGLSAGTWKGIARGLAIASGIMLLLLALFSLLLPPTAELDTMSSLLFTLGTVALLALGYAGGGMIGERLRWPLVAAWVLLYPFTILMIRGIGGAEGPWQVVQTSAWGGLMLTLLLAITAIVASFPIGVLLALGRRSDLPIVKIFCIGYIELIRGVPLITVLFMAQVMLPLFLPAGWRVDALLRAMVAMTLFSAAYVAENVRGGLQSLPRGQTEAARALGLNVVQTTMLITLPQALRAVIPVLVGQFIGLFKDTSLVTIVGLLELLGMARTIISQPDWLQVSGGVWRETFLVVALIYFVFSFAMSRTSLAIERRTNAGKD
jgi:general L-amino acid transport system permease protein